MGTVILFLFYFLFPALVIHLDKKYSLVNKIGSVLICYGVGLLIGNIGILPDGIAPLQEEIYGYVIVIAIPLLLFSLDIKKWVKMAGKTFLSMVLGLVSVIVMAMLGYFIYKDVIPEIWKISGVLVGFYSGGAPNAAAISLAVEMEPETFILTQTYDLVVGFVTILFLMTVAQRFFLLFMDPYKAPEMEDTDNLQDTYHGKYQSYDGIFRRSIIFPLLGAVGLSILILGISAGISMLITKAISMTLVILGITSMGIAASFVPRIKNIDKSFQVGIYLILVFCLIFASMADISMFSLESVPILMYVVLVVPGALLLHGILSKIFKVDVDNFLIISVALSMSPPFVPVIAASLKNRDIILPGMIIGLLGYAIGNYLGVAIAYLVQSFG